MKTVILNIMNTIVSFVKAHTVIAIVTASAVVVAAVAVPVGISIAKNNKIEATPEKIVSSEPVDDTASSEASEPESVEKQEVADVSSDESTSSEPKPTPPVSNATSRNESTTSTPTPPTNESSNTITSTAPSAAALEYSGLTASESKAAVEAAQTCPLCGQNIGGNHHLYGKDMNCSECGELCKANTCHFCEQ